MYIILGSGEELPGQGDGDAIPIILSVSV
jgi:hypothetical protein